MFKTLAIGSKGSEVQVCQKSLNIALHKTPLLTTDGIFGLATQGRVKEFQRSARLAVDGVVGPKTWTSLLSASGGGTAIQRSLITPTGAGTAPDTASLPCCGANEEILKMAQAMAANYEALAWVAGIVTPLSQSVKYSTTTTPPPGTPPGARGVNLAEKAILIPVFGSSINFDTVVMTTLTGAGGRAFVLTVKPPGFGLPAIQIVNAGHSPSNNTLTHEFTHVWQSQHSANPMQYMSSAVLCQALEATTNSNAGKTVCSAYAYVPGRKFTEYNVEQIAQQVGNGVTAIQAYCRSVAKGAVDVGAMTCEALVSVEFFATPGAKI